MINKLLVIGASGELGYQIIKNSNNWSTFATYYSNPQTLKDTEFFKLDISDKDRVYSLISKINPDVVINTAVSDRSIKSLDQDRGRGIIINGALNIAYACKKTNARAIFLSSDLVFDGTKGSYKESDETNPLSPYGEYKAEMEERLLKLNFNLVIVRTSLIITFEPMGHQVSWIVNSLNNGIKLRLFTDEYRSPILGNDLSVAILQLAESDYKGLINIGGSYPLNRYEIGMKIAQYYKLNTEMIEPVQTSESGLLRPQNCTLDSSKAFNLLNLNIGKF